MTRLAKLYAGVAANPGSALAFREFERLLEASGFVLERINGSHRQYVHPDIPFVLTVQPRDKDAVPYQVRRWLAMVTEYGLDIAT